MRSSKWPGGNLNCQLNGNIAVYPPGSIAVLETKTSASAEVSAALEW